MSEFVKDPFTDDATFDFHEFSNTVKQGVIYLNEILDENMHLHPLKEQTKVSKDLRQIGLGIFGNADMLIKMGLRYGSDESLALIDKVGSAMANSALQQSALLAKEHGAFPLYNKKALLGSPYLNEVASEETMDLISEHGLFNSQILTIPPTGSTATLLGVSNGIEPIFQLNYLRRTQSLHGIDTEYEVFTEIVGDYMELHNMEDVKDLPDYFITSSEIHYSDRIKMQSTWQKYIDSAISSTVNLPESATADDIEELYMMAWEYGLKGITVYRENCLRAGILTTKKDDPEKENTTQDENELNCNT